MTEAEWLHCSDPEPMLEFVRNKVSDRRLRLFSCTCCRHVWDLLTEAGRRAVEVAEQLADGRVGLHQVTSARTAAMKAGFAWEPPYWACSYRAAESVWQCSVGAIEAVARRESDAVPPAQRADVYEQAHLSGAAEQAALLRHLTGNIFHTPLTTTDWSRQVLQLAQALYAGTDCAFALHDALLESGHAELADHFVERDHPKGCWALDRILGRT